MTGKATFRAAVLTKIGQPLEIHDLYFPELTSGQVLVQNLLSGVCRSQLMEVQGARGDDKWLPHLLGHEGYGIVREVAEDVKKVAPGDLVIASWIKGDGIDAVPPSYQSTANIRVHSGSVTTFSEFSVISESRVFIAPQGFKEEILPLFGCAFLTGAGMVLNFLSDASEYSVAVYGFGGIGMSVAVVLRGMNPRKLFIIERSAEKRALATSLGFENVTAPEDNYLRNKKFDYCFEAAGSIGSIQAAWDLLESNGTLVFASHPPQGQVIALDPHDLIKGKRIFGTWGGNVSPDKDLPRIATLLRNSGLNLETLLGNFFLLSEVNAALSYLESGSPGRPILDFRRN
jgi:S-(hydroxymethyl)glutathione dehydrogenase/alcohol dehydrogenase